MRLFLLTCIVLASLNSCTFFSSTSDDQILATAFGEELHYNEVASRIPKMVSEEDSLNIVNAYINQWTEQQVLLNKAAYNIDDSLMDEINSKLEDYKNSLLIFEYEKRLLLAQMDTSVSEKEIQEYYKEHSHNFKIQEPIGRFLFIKVPKQSSVLKNISKAYKLKDQSDSLYLNEIASLELEYSHLDTKQWLLVDQIINQTPLKEKLIDKKTFLKQNKHVEIEEQNIAYFIKIVDYRLVGDEAPLEFIKEKIKMIIRNHKKTKILRKIRSELVKLAIRKNDVEIFQ